MSGNKRDRSESKTKRNLPSESDCEHYGASGKYHAFQLRRERQPERHRREQNCNLVEFCGMRSPRCVSGYEFIGNIAVDAFAGIQNINGGRGTRVLFIFGRH